MSFQESQITKEKSFLQTQKVLDPVVFDIMSNESQYQIRLLIFLRFSLKGRDEKTTRMDK